MTETWFRLFASAWLVSSGVLVMGMQPGSALRTIARGAESSIDAPRQAVARTSAEWLALWKAHDYGKPVPPVDFSREMVVAVFMGGRPTAGYSVEIVSAAQRGGVLVVEYREQAPPGDALTAQILTSPFHIVAVPRQERPVRFERVGN